MYKMAFESSTMQNYNTQLVECIKDMREKRDMVNGKITANEEEKKILVENIKKCQKQLSDIEEDLIKDNTACTKYDQTIQEIEAAYMGIIESSQTLLHVLKTEASKISEN